MREIHGVAGVHKLAAFSGDIQSVRVEDGSDHVRLSLSTSSFPAGLSPVEARFVAAALIASAERVEDRRGEARPA
jgi:hypothetical protein